MIDSKKIFQKKLIAALSRIFGSWLIVQEWTDDF
jgi:hypothetical protein